MTLAHVVYQISTDTDFASAWRENPELALENRGLSLSKEEQAFLTMSLQGYNTQSQRPLELAQLGYALSWG